MKFFMHNLFLMVAILSFYIRASDYPSLVDGFHGGKARRTYDTVMNAMDKHGATASARGKMADALEDEIDEIQEKTRKTFVRYLDHDLNSLGTQNSQIQTIIDHGQKSEWKSVKSELEKLKASSKQKQFIVYELLHQTLPEERWDRPACCAQATGIIFNSLSTITGCIAPLLFRTQCGATAMIGCPFAAQVSNPCCLGVSCLLYTAPKCASILPMIVMLREKRQLPNDADVVALVEYAHSLEEDSIILQPQTQVPPQL